MANKALITAWAIALIGYGALAVWVLAHPPSIPSDDAFFFVAGVERFSVLEFRPHFPGYPGFIALGKLFTHLGLSAQKAVFILSGLSALLLPPLAAWVTKVNGASSLGVLVAFAATLTQPFLPLVGLNMMSDATGIAFMLAALAFLGMGKNGLGGAMAGITLACRPSFLVPVVLVLVVGWLQNKRARTKLAFGFLSVFVFFFGSVVALEGSSYFYEGLRFIEGHFLTWGNTTFAYETERSGWWAAFKREPLALGMVLIWVLVGLKLVIAKAEFSLLPVAAIGALIWTVFAQNPENLRHVLLPTILFVVFISIFVNKKTLGFAVSLSVLQAMVLMSSISSKHQPSPLERVAGYLMKERPGLILTNRGVTFMRQMLPSHRIADAFYRENSISLRKRNGNEEVWVMTAVMNKQDRNKDGLVVFVGRVPGEKELMLKKTEVQ